MPHKHGAYEWPRGGSKKHALSLSKGSSSPVLSHVEGKAAGIFAGRAYFQYVSTETWRPACAKPLRRRQGTPLAAPSARLRACFFNSPRIYLPPDANSLLFVTDTCLRSRNRVNVIVAGKQPGLQFLSMDTVIKHCAAGIGTWEWVSNDKEGEPDVVMAYAGDISTLETLAAVDLLRNQVPDLKALVVNV